MGCKFLPSNYHCKRNNQQVYPKNVGWDLGFCTQRGFVSAEKQFKPEHCSWRLVSGQTNLSSVSFIHNLTPGTTAKHRAKPGFKGKTSKIKDGIYNLLNFLSFELTKESSYKLSFAVSFVDIPCFFRKRSSVGDLSTACRFQNLTSASQKSVLFNAECEWVNRSLFCFALAASKCFVVWRQYNIFPEILMR